MNNLNQVNGKEQNVPKTEISKKENTIKEQPAAIYEKDEKKDVEKKGHTYDATAIAKLKMQTEQNKLKVFDLIRKSLGKQTEFRIAHVTCLLLTSPLTLGTQG